MTFSRYIDQMALGFKYLKKPKGYRETDYSMPLVEQFEIERMITLRRAVSLGSVLCAILIPLFGLLDLIIKPQLFWTFFMIRLSVTLISIKIYLLSKSRFGKKHPYALAAFLAIAVCFSIAVMCFLDKGPVDPYYAGINLPILGFGIMLPLTLFEGIFVCILIWLFYFIPNLIGLKPQETGIFINNNFFLISSIIISLAGSRFNFHYTKNQWLSRRKLQSAHRRIKRHAAELEIKVQERTQKLLQSERLAVVGQLAGGVAHDFNNILTSILGTSELLLTTLPNDDPIRTDIEGIKRVGKRASDLVKQLLAFSCRQILLPKVLNLNDIIKDIEKMLRRLIGEDIELIFELSKDLGNVLADSIQIEQIILNLAVNARDAMPKGGTLIIETSDAMLDVTYCHTKGLSVPPGKYVMLAFSDTGIGMNNEIKAKIFEPFFTTKGKGKGTGLGLSTVYGIVKQSNGDIFVYSEKEKGTTFKIFFPKTEKNSLKNDSFLNIPIEIPKGKETILLVEDEDEVRTLTARMLENQGYKVISAKEGHEAISIAKRHSGQIDLLMTDLIMPQMDGQTLAQKMISSRSDIKVLFVSGYTNSMILHQSILNSSNQFLQKPYTLENLHLKIRDLLDRQ